MTAHAWPPLLLHRSTPTLTQYYLPFTLIQYYPPFTLTQYYHRHRDSLLHRLTPTLTQYHLPFTLTQYYHRHRDSLPNDSPRMATILIYLADPEVGGETAFPEHSKWANAEAGEKYSKEFSECAKVG